MQVTEIARQTSAGIIVGISAVIYSISYGALMFSGALSGYVGHAITVALITAVAGALFGCLSEEKRFFAGPDSNTISVLAGVLAVSTAAAGPEVSRLDQAVALVIVTALLSAAVLFAVGRARLSVLVRYIPFSVMAGFLASTGWLMASGALNIISATPLTLAGLQRLLADPVRPELAFGLLVVAALYGLASRISTALLIPLVMVGAALLVNGMLALQLCDGPLCDARLWLFAPTSETAWLPPWQLDWSHAALGDLLSVLPGMLVVSFIGLLTILLSVASLELSFQHEFDLDKVLERHAGLAVVSAALGGFFSVVSVGRTMLNKQTGGGMLSGVVAAMICVASLFSGGRLFAYLPKAALGGLILYLGLNMIKQWLWDQRKSASKLELAQIALILVLAATAGFLIAFVAGLLIACVMFVVTYSRIPIAALATDLSVFKSSVARPEQQMRLLRQHGSQTQVIRLAGYVFFGSVMKIDEMFRMNKEDVRGVVVDFSKVSGIDSSAIGAFRRILRRYQGEPVRFYLVYAPENEASARKIGEPAGDSAQVRLFPSLDQAVETAEDDIIARHAKPDLQEAHFEFFEDPDERAQFLGLCRLRQIAAGELLCAENERSNEIFFVRSGVLEVFKEGAGKRRLRLAKLHSGAMVGEMAFYTGDVRSASIAALEDSAIYVLHREDMARLRESKPRLAMHFDQMIIQRLAQSLARTSQLVAMFN